MEKFTDLINEAKLYTNRINELMESRLLTEKQLSEGNELVKKVHLLESKMANHVHFYRYPNSTRH
jgi:hypothetical protein